jgi:phage tail-like protein
LANPVPTSHHDAWDPVSVAASPNGGHVLDAAHGLVYRFRDPLGSPEVIVRAAAGRWRRLAVDSEGRLYLLAARDGENRLDVFGPDGANLGSITDAGEVADRFDPPAVTADHRRRLHVAAALLARCPRLGPLGSEGTWFDPATGERAIFADDEWIGPPTYLTRGTWIGGPLDSAVYRCQWHRVVLDLGRLPAGSRLRVSTYTDARERTSADILSLPEDFWSAVPDIVGPAAQHLAQSQTPSVADTAVMSREGRFLWLRLDLSGNGQGTPTVGGAQVFYPRHSQLELLPAVYSADDAARRFLERFLAVFQTQLEPIEHTIRDMAGLFDPDAATPAMVDALSSWLALPREGDWDAAQRRNLLRAVPRTVTDRGTLAALSTYVRAYLENMTGIQLADDHFPHLVEGYRERNYLALTGREPVGGRSELWGPGKVARLQLDRFATVGKVRLVTTGDPDRDVFHYYAHRFRVVAPASWVRTAADERMLRRAIEAEKPAHTAYQLALINPGIRLGGQATIGLDTIIGGLPRASLACRHDSESAPSRPPRGRLGVDIVLSADPHRSRDLRINARVGADAMQL